MFCVTLSIDVSHNKEAGRTTPTWSLPFRTQNHLLNAVSRVIYCLITTATTSNTIASLDAVVWFTPTVLPLRAKHLLASHYRDKLICYESSHVHKMDGTKPNQTGNMVGKKHRKQAEGNGQKSSQQRTLSPGRHIAKTNEKTRR